MGQTAKGKRAKPRQRENGAPGEVAGDPGTRLTGHRNPAGEKPEPCDATQGPDHRTSGRRLGGEGAGRVQQRWPGHLRPGEPGPQQLYNSWSPEPGRKPKAQAPEDSPGKPKPRADAKGRTHPHGRVPTPGRKAAPPSPSAPLQTTLPPSTARLSSDSPGFARGQTPTVRAAC